MLLRLTGRMSARKSGGESQRPASLRSVGLADRVPPGIVLVRHVLVYRGACGFMGTRKEPG